MNIIIFIYQIENILFIIIIEINYIVYLIIIPVLYQLHYIFPVINIQCIFSTQKNISIKIKNHVLGLIFFFVYIFDTYKINYISFYIYESKYNYIQIIGSHTI